jgi:hypothetical protein
MVPMNCPEVMERHEKHNTVPQSGIARASATLYSGWNIARKYRVRLILIQGNTLSCKYFFPFPQRRKSLE